MVTYSIRSAYILPVLALLFLAACDLHHPSYMTQNRIQVEQERFMQSYDAAAFDEAAVQGLRRYYDRYGDGPVQAGITYDPLSKTNTAMIAGNRAATLSEQFRKEGFQASKINILPVKNSRDESKLLISFNTYQAKPPKDCDVMPGIISTQMEANADYKLGCSIDTVFARQISRPSDLAGQATLQDTSDGRRAAWIVENYRQGYPNEALEGESASGTE